MAWLRTVVLLLLAVGAGVQAGQTPPDERVARGRAIYLEGRLPSGGEIAAYVQGDIKVSGAQVICGNCHRRSGMGSSEGSQIIPPLAGNRLFEPVRLPTSKKPLAPMQRPAYTLETLKRAIRSGIDANGRPLDPLMPRYPLDDEAIADLVAYLKTLSTRPSPGVDDKEIHFATIIAGDVPARSRQALRSVMQAFVEQKNANTRNETYRAANAPWHKKWLFEPYRKWVVHVWELQGPEESWAEQLEERYREQPVFAILSGVAAGRWAPIHGFCEREAIPCLFPTTDLPVVSHQDFYSLYLSRGMSAEARVLGRFLKAAGHEGPVIQVYREGDERAATAARALREYLGESRVITRSLQPGQSADAYYWMALLNDHPDAVLAAWLKPADLQALWHLDPAPGVRLYLSDTLFGGRLEAIPETLREQVRLVRTKELPGRLSRLLLRSTGWFRARHIYVPEEKDIQANAYFTLKVVGDALTHTRGYFYRDYLVERIEHMIDDAPYTSVYPRLSLAPEQRFAAKGGYIARPGKQKEMRLVAVTDWLIP